MRREGEAATGIETRRLAQGMWTEKGLGAAAAGAGDKDAERQEIF